MTGARERAAAELQAWCGDALGCIAHLQEELNVARGEAIEARQEAARERRSAKQYAALWHQAQRDGDAYLEQRREARAEAAEWRRRAEKAEKDWRDAEGIARQRGWLDARQAETLRQREAELLRGQETLLSERDATLAQLRAVEAERDNLRLMLEGRALASN